MSKENKAHRNRHRSICYAGDVLGGMVLIAAAWLKLYELSNQLSPSSLLLNSLVATIIATSLELGIGVWVCLPQMYRLKRLAACLLFLSLSLFSLYKVLDGSTNCGCFGPLKVAPVITFWLDVFLANMFLLSFLSTKASENRHVIRLRWRFVQISSLLIISTTIAVSLIPTKMVAFADTTFHKGEAVLLDPSRWLGQEFKLGRGLVGTANLKNGNWIVLFVNANCNQCSELIDIVYSLDTGHHRLMVIEVTSKQVARLSNAPKVQVAQLNQELTWVIDVPTLVRLESSKVVEVTADFDSAKKILREYDVF